MTLQNPSTAFWAALRGEPITDGEPMSVEDWSRVVERARREGVLPLIASLQSSCPDRALIRREAAIAHLSRLALYRRVAAAMAPTGVPWAAVKGLAVAQRLYANPADRPSGDCDILVRPADREAAAAALCSAGFHPTPHHAELFVGEEGEVDLHTYAVNRERVAARAGLRIIEPDWLAGRHTIATEAGDLPVLDDEDLAVFLSLHLVHHHGGIGARWLNDLRLLLMTRPAARQRLERGDAGRAGATTLHLLRSLWPGEFTPSAAAPTKTGAPRAPIGLLDHVTLAAARNGEEVPGLRFLHTLRELPFGAKLAFLVQTLIPSRSVLDAVAVPRAMSPITLHLSQLARTAFSLSRLAWRTINSGS